MWQCAGFHLSASGNRSGHWLHGCYGSGTLDGEAVGENDRNLSGIGVHYLGELSHRRFHECLTVVGDTSAGLGHGFDQSPDSGSRLRSHIPCLAGFCMTPGSDIRIRVWSFRKVRCLVVSGGLRTFMWLTARPSRNGISTADAGDIRAASDHGLVADGRYRQIDNLSGREDSPKTRANQ